MRAGSKAKSSWVTLAMIGATVAALLVLSTSALGQCSMCRAALAGSNNALFIRNFNIGVLVLLVPPVTIFCSIFVALKRYKATDDEATEKEGAWSDPKSD